MWNQEAKTHKSINEGGREGEREGGREGGRGRKKIGEK